MMGGPSPDASSQATDGGFFCVEGVARRLGEAFNRGGIRRRRRRRWCATCR